MRARGFFHLIISFLCNFFFHNNTFPFITMFSLDITIMVSFVGWNDIDDENEKKTE